MKKLLYIFLLAITAGVISSCYNGEKPEGLAQNATDSIGTSDSAQAYSSRHYGIGYNFIVHNDSLLLIVQQPEEHVSLLTTDTLFIGHDTHIAVADFRVLPQDSVDSVWVQVVSEAGEIGWIHETELLPNVVPTDPISQIIMLFSDTHVLLALIFVVLITAAYTMRLVQRHQAPLVHFRDIPSFYPTLLCMTVAASATFYASLQMFGADIWRHYYYHPTLNPFLTPPILNVFICSVWAMLIIGIAAIEDTRHHLNFEDATLYISSLIGFCAVIYIIFSISTLYYIGYPLLVAYCWFAVTRYKRHFSLHYVCGNCGKRIREKGTCPHCGAINE